jgi:coenzyme PQQ precursor peptide PqqA
MPRHKGPEKGAEAGVTICSEAPRPIPPAGDQLTVALLQRAKGSIYHHSAWRRLLPAEHGKTIMAWTTPTLVEICIGLEINGYLPAEF